MKIDFPGLIEEKMPSGNIRYRVRVAGNKNRRITLSIQPDHKQFKEHYLAARQGIAITEEWPEDEPKAVKGSLKWLIEKYLMALETKVEQKTASEQTYKQRHSLLTRLYDDYGNYTKDMPQTYVIRLRDEMAATPGAADNMVKSLRAMYTWANETGLCTTNPATGVSKLIKQNKGATPWTVEDLHKYRETHQPGTTAHLCLTLFMFTACRISDAIKLGRDNEFERAGIRGLGWQPSKKGSNFVEVPMLPPLFEATRTAKVQGSTYLLTEYGKPFSSPEGLRNRFRKWCDEAGLHERTSHGIRKAVGHLLAHHGCTQYQIMAIQGHTQAKTSEVYTKGVERWQLAIAAMDKLKTLEW
nr:tyrosine-type recombinase/integrase [uncultured Cohaesibacter sp.]